MQIPCKHKNNTRTKILPDKQFYVMDKHLLLIRQHGQVLVVVESSWVTKTYSVVMNYYLDGFMIKRM
jgi:hypothetical protein